MNSTLLRLGTFKATQSDKTLTTIRTMMKMTVSTSHVKKFPLLVRFLVVAKFLRIIHTQSGSGFLDYK